MKKIFFILILFIFTGVANLTYADSKISSIVVAGDSKTVTVNVVAEDSPLSVCVGYKDSFLKPGGICLAHEEKTVPVVDPAVVVSFVLDISKVTTPGEYDVSLKSGKNSKGIGHFTLGQKASTEAWMYFGYFSKSKDFTTKTLCEDDLKQVKSISVDPEKTYLNSALCLQKGSAEYNSKLATWTSAVVINQNQTQKIFKEDYTLLAPLGDTTKIDGTTKVGDYLNTILLIAIGLCGALAVIMIVIYGVQYMGDESVFGKTEAKSHIMAAIMGLLLALGAYTILNTINPNLVGGSLTFNSVNITISAEDTSTGSSTTLCLSNPPPNPDGAIGSSKITLNDAEKKYVEEINKISSIPKGNKLLMIAQTHIEGFKPGTKSYKTNNPGNIGNTDKAPSIWTCSSPGIRCFATLADGIKAQSEMYARIGTNTSVSYVINGTNKCALGSEKYDGSLYQYLWIYSTGARTSNSYANQIIGYFAQEGVKITARTKMSEIYKMK